MEPDTAEGPAEEGGENKMIFKMPEIEMSPEVKVEEKKPESEAAAGTGNQASKSEKVQSQMIKKVHEHQADAGSTGSDEILNIS